MSRSERLLDLIQVLRRHRRPVSGQALADELGVSLRTVYRDIQTLIGQGAAIDGEAGIGFVLRPGGVAAPPASHSPSPTATPSATPTPSPSPTVRPGYGTEPSGFPTPAPFGAATALPDPSGAPLPADLVGREYNANPLETQGPQALVLTLRGPDDPHCVALYHGSRSTCFTILWRPGYPKHVGDPGARGSARIVDGKLVLGFDVVIFDKPCEGTTSTYAISEDRSTLTAVDVPACSFQGFIAH